MLYPDPVGRCIYCGKDDAPLSDEHVVPSGLGGRIILPDASCEACAKITCSLEGYCLRKTFPVVRTRLGIKSRNKNEQSRMHEQLYVNPRTGGRRTHATPRQDAPFAVFGMYLPPPTILTGVPAGERIPIGTWTKSLKDNWWGDAQPGEAVAFGEVKMDRFCRMLAKIAHAFAHASWGAECFYPLLLELILGKTVDWPQFVGGYFHLKAPSERSLLHTTSIGVRRSVDGKQYVVVHLRLFSNCGAPEYRIVVGDLVALEKRRAPRNHPRAK